MTYFHYSDLMKKYDESRGNIQKKYVPRAEMAYYKYGRNLANHKKNRKKKKCQHQIWNTKKPTLPKAQ